MLVYIGNDTPPLSYSADISDVFLVSFVSMMEHGCQFHDRNSDGCCSIEFPFSGQRALQRTPSLTYLVVISPSHLPATDIAVLHGSGKPTDFSFSLWQLKMILLLNHEIFNDSPSQSSLYSFPLSTFLTHLVQLHVAFSSRYLLNSGQILLSLITIEKFKSI